MTSIGEKLTNSSDIQLATVSDYDEILIVMDRANDYARQLNGEPMWTNMDAVHHQLSTQLEQGICYVTRDSTHKITAAMTLDQEDGRMWGEQGLDGQALYIHKLMKDPSAAEPQAGLKFIAFAAHQAVQRHRQFVRCDTKPTHAHLVAYYNRLGFRSAGNAVYGHSGVQALLLEADSKSLLKQIIDNLATKA